MGIKKTDKTPETGGVEDYLPMVNDLMDKIRNKPDWTDDDEVKLKKLDKLIGLLGKIANLEKKMGRAEIRINRAGDDSLIKRYFQRKNGRKNAKKN